MFPRCPRSRPPPARILLLFTALAALAARVLAAEPLASEANRAGSSRQSAATAEATAKANPDFPGQLLGSVWAGHPVSFALLTSDNHQAVAYYDAERRITVATRTLGSAVWATVRPEGRLLAKTNRLTNVLGWDSHNYLALAADRDGQLHLSGNMHGDELAYWRTTRAWDAATFERLDRMTGEKETACTYPVFFQNTAGDLFFRYRDGASGNGSDFYNAYDPAAHAWRRLLSTPLLDGEKQRNAYALNPTPGPDGRFHLVWMWRDTPDCSTNNHLSYARSADLLHWEDHLGRPLALPITLAHGDIVDAAKPREGLINMTFALGFDAAKNPVVLYHRYDAAGHSQIFAARPDGDGWRTRAVTDWTFKWAFSGTGSITGDLLLAPPTLAPDGTLTIPYETRALGPGRVQFRAADLTPLAAMNPSNPSAAKTASGSDLLATRYFFPPLRPPRPARPRHGGEPQALLAKRRELRPSLGNAPAQP